jgi:hypothetical protein
MSDGFPTRAAIIKSKGEQFAGQACVAGFVLAVFTSEQFYLELLSGHDPGIYVGVLLHGTPEL